VVAAAIRSANETRIAAENAQHAAALAMAAAGGQQPPTVSPLPSLPPWMAPPPGTMTTPKIQSTPSGGMLAERPPGFNIKIPSVKSPPGKGSSDSIGSEEASDAASKVVRVGCDAETKEFEVDEEDDEDDEDEDGESLPPKSKSLPAFLGEVPEDCPSLGSALHGSGDCTPCAWFWKDNSCNNGKDCRYCHLCPDGELKKRKKAKVAAMRSGVVTPKNKSPVAHTLSLSSLI